MFPFINLQNYDKNGQIDIPECRPISMAKVEYAHNKDRETRIFKPMEGAHVYPQLERISSTLQCQWDYRKDLKEKAGVIRPSDASVKIQGSAKITNNNYYYSEDDFSFIDFYDDAINCFGQLVLEKTFQLPHERQPAILVNNIINFYNTIFLPSFQPYNIIHFRCFRKKLKRGCKSTEETFPPSSENCCPTNDRWVPETLKHYSSFWSYFV